MNDFAAEPEQFRLDELAAMERVLRSGTFILGAEVSAFEAEWATRCGVSHGIGVANGMDAIEIGLRCLRIGPGDEVITTPMTAFATVLAIIRAGATPVLADITAGTALLDPRSVERCITPRTRAILLVHLYGRIDRIDEWREVAKQADAVLIEDCAQAHLARWQGRPAGSHGVYGAFSFYPTKNLGTIGDGGALVTQSEDIARQARILRNYGQSVRYLHPETGMNSRLDELHAALLRVRLDRLDELTGRRRSITERYSRGIRNPAVTPLAEPEDPLSHVHHLYVVQCQKRDRLIARLDQSHIDTLIHYPVPVHFQESCRSWIRTDPAGLQVAERHAATCVSLPCHPFMKDGDVERVIEAVNAYG